jgi:phytoene synthase
MTPLDYCRQKVAQPGSKLYYSTLFLPPSKRESIIALEACFREIADVIDECQDAAVARIKLAWWREELERAFSDTPRHPVSQALRPAIAAHNLDFQTFSAFIDGINMQLQYDRYQTSDDLRHHCQRVGSPAALLSARIFGYEDGATVDYARELGVAHELARIVRDIGRDAQRNRIYLPIEDLRRFDVQPSVLLNAGEAAGFQSLIMHQIERAEEQYRNAIARLPENDRAQQLPGLIRAALDCALLQELRAEDTDILRRHTTLPALRMLWIAWYTRRKERHRRRQWQRQRT